MNNEEDLPSISDLEKEQGNGKELGVGRQAKDFYEPEELEAIRVDLGNKIYAAAKILEEHEHYHGKGPGCLQGNGHHARQKAAQVVQNMFVERLRPSYRRFFDPDGFGGYKFNPRKELRELAKNLVQGSMGDEEAQQKAQEGLTKRFGKNAKAEFF